MALPIPPKLFHPRALVVLNVILDDQIPGSPGVTVAYNAVPRSCEVKRNTARKADTAQVVLDYRDFPMDPRGIRDVRLTVHIEDSLTPQALLIPTRLNLRFQGLVDRHEVTLGPDEEVVTLEARDFTGIWLDRRWPSDPVLDQILLTGLTLQAVVEAMRLRVTPLILPTVFLDPTTAALMPTRFVGKTQFTAGKDDDAWTVLSKLLANFGLVPVFDRDILTVRTASTKGLNVAAFVYGQNVSRLMFRRSLSKGPSSRRIVIHSWDPIKGRALTGGFPLINDPRVARFKMNEKGVGTLKITNVEYNVEGQYTPLTIGLLAEKVYNEQAQQEIEGDLETRDLTDTSNIPGKLLAIANGDTLLVRLGRELRASIEGLSPAEAIALLSDPTKPNTLNPAVAAALVQAWTTTQAVAVTFYVREASHTWDREQGYKLSITFINFLLGPT